MAIIFESVRLKHVYIFFYSLENKLMAIKMQNTFYSIVERSVFLKYTLNNKQDYIM